MKTYTESQVLELLKKQRDLCIYQIKGPIFGTLPLYWQKKIQNTPLVKI